MPRGAAARFSDDRRHLQTRLRESRMGRGDHQIGGNKPSVHDAGNGDQQNVVTDLAVGNNDWRGGMFVNE